jgi:hypothetical protein
MALATSETRTVLWDQIQYAGDPGDFSWVLPVRPGAYLEASTDAWFEALDSVTTTRVSAPPLTCAQPDSPSSGCGCGTMSASADLAAPGAGGFVDNGVSVLHVGTVGPYETVTLSSTDGDALTSWLDAHDYQVPPDIEPVITAYVDEGFDFIALRLASNQSVSQMTPVRVVTPGPPAPLPLRMVAAGVGAYVDITLYVIGEGRHALPDLHEVTLDLDLLRWDFGTSTSNYLEVREEALSELRGFNYLTTFADRGAFVKTYSDADGVPLVYQPGGVQTGPTYSNLADLYFGQARYDDAVPLSTPSCPSIASLLARDELVIEDSSAGELDARAFTCSPYDDIGAAMIGMHPARVWLTRFDLDLPRDALSADCVVSLHESQAAVSHTLRAARSDNRPDSCADAIFEASVVGGSRREALAWLSMLAVALYSRLRRLRSQ